MNKKVNEKVKSRCNICNKFYAINSSLCNHIKNIHNNDDKNISTEINYLSTEINYLSTKKKNTYNCRYCNKEYNINQSKWRHEQKCKINNDNLIMINKQKEIEMIKL
jgi:hypothetical protein